MNPRLSPLGSVTIVLTVAGRCSLTFTVTSCPDSVEDALALRTRLGASPVSDAAAGGECAHERGHADSRTERAKGRVCSRRPDLDRQGLRWALNSEALLLCFKPTCRLVRQY